MSLPTSAARPSINFENLPSELRIKIWKYMLPGPRVVSVRFDRGAKEYTSSTAPPILLRTCPESRTVALEMYTNLVLSPKYTSSVFVDFDIDTIFFDSLDCSPQGDLSYDLATSPHKDRVLSCAIDVQLWEVLRVFRYESLSELQWMRNLKTVALIMPKDTGMNRRTVEGGEGGRVVVGVDTSLFSDELRHAYYYVEGLQKELDEGDKEHWRNGVPNVQMWLW
ncbi:hypothetical protein D0Z07_2902 [Hyphodiscus hymeniophilus]|uniref:2EXR domain-containing protein n=1 Tax=Hyphodiscus hymeniophilus TaxID=353542 RepID=A0A9P6VM63_9HELO|nr:hypothetical protein D0Z07_2902 [Hyphodiscus hymeniophilus]